MCWTVLPSIRVRHVPGCVGARLPCSCSRVKHLSNHDQPVAKLGRDPRLDKQAEKLPVLFWVTFTVRKPVVPPVAVRGHRCYQDIRHGVDVAWLSLAYASFLLGAHNSKMVSGLIRVGGWAVTRVY